MENGKISEKLIFKGMNLALEMVKRIKWNKENKIKF